MRVLVLEDDPRVCREVAHRLRGDGHAVDEVRVLRDARAALRDTDYDCLVLDRLVPDGDAIELVAELRAEGWRGPILIVSILGGADDRIAGLRAGADDYLGKPARLEEVALRVRALLIRSGLDGEERSTPPPVVAGRVTLLPGLQEVQIDGEPVDLSPTQYRMIEYLLLHRDRIVTAQELLDNCWDRNRPDGNPLPPQLTRVRHAFAGVLEIESVRGRGYRVRPLLDDEGSHNPDGFA